MSCQCESTMRAKVSSLCCPISSAESLYPDWNILFKVESPYSLSNSQDYLFAFWTNRASYWLILEDRRWLFQQVPHNEYFHQVDLWLLWVEWQSLSFWGWQLSACFLAKHTAALQLVALGLWQLACAPVSLFPRPLPTLPRAAFLGWSLWAPIR